MNYCFLKINLQFYYYVFMTYLLTCCLYIRRLKFFLELR